MHCGDVPALLYSGTRAISPVLNPCLFTTPVHRNIDGRMLSSPYPVSTGSKVTTNRWLHVRRGRHVRLCSLSLVSNSKVEEAEFDHWARQCQRDDEGRLTHKDVRTAQELLNQVGCVGGLQLT